jgi:hypothetical protein
MRQIAITLLLISLALAACAGRTAGSPTPFPTAAASLTPAGEGPIVLTLTELAAAPGLYRDAVVQVTGLLRKQPLVVCEKDYHPSPASWGLAEGGIMALAGGFDGQVRSLLPDDLLMTVEGRWRRWEGIVGCGKQAQSREVWFLDVARIVSPTPLTQVTLTPGSGGEATAVTELSPTPLGGGIGGGPEPSPEATPAETPGAPQATTPPDAYPGPGPIATLPVELTPTTAAASTPDATVTAGTPEATLPGGTTTPTGSPTPTVTGTPPTQTPTATGGATGQVVPRGDLVNDLFTEFAAVTLAAGTVDSWTMNLVAGDAMYVYAIAPLPANLTLSVLKDGQTLVNRQNTAPAGAPEFLNAPTLPGPGLYEIHVAAEGNQSTEYAIAAYTDPDFAITFSGLLQSGQPRNGAQLPVDGVHLWFFSANAGDDLTLTLDPAGQEDPTIDIYEPGGTFMDFVDDGVEGQTETYTVTLSTTGMYALRISEVFSQMMTYDLLITLE